MPQNAIETTSVPKTASHTITPVSPLETPNQVASTVAETIPPSMNTSPWAKLISSRMP